jgi:hypothetical protein
VVSYDVGAPLSPTPQQKKGTGVSVYDAHFVSAQNFGRPMIRPKLEAKLARLLAVKKSGLRLIAKSFVF